LELKWETEQEEKRLLKEQLQALETWKQAAFSKLQEDLSKVEILDSLTPCSTPQHSSVPNVIAPL
ncbi:hypothetical protein chiPu_0029895, partial [Chiloscyllium punctatum]|nr:hypothetical protein [Chiloscyllium punctatum]